MRVNDILRKVKRKLFFTNTYVFFLELLLLFKKKMEINEHECDKDEIIAKVIL